MGNELWLGRGPEHAHTQVPTKLAQTLSQSHWFKLEPFWQPPSSKVFKLLVGKNHHCGGSLEMGRLRHGAQAGPAADAIAAAGAGADH